MRVKVKLQLIIIPLILIPVFITAYIFGNNSSESIYALHSDSMNRNLEIIMNQLEQENSVLDRLGAENTQFYKKNAQSYARNFVLDLQLLDGTIQIFENKTKDIVNENTLFDRSFYDGLYQSIKENEEDSFGPYEDIVERSHDKYAIYYQYFEPWDWLVMIYMDEAIIYESIEKSINEILLVVLLLMVILTGFLYVVTSKLTAPVDILLDGIHAISEGDYTSKVYVHTNDEYRDFANAFNEMSDRLQESFDSLNQMTDELMLMNTELENRVEERTGELKESNNELELSIIQLRAAQDDLVESRKIAALGSLVTGISHELNTPIGIGITTASYITLQIESLEKLYLEGKLRKQDFEQDLASIRKSAKLILDNLNHASNMVSSFKLIAVDQSLEEKKEFELIHSIENLSHNLNVLLRKGHHELIVEGEKPIEMYSYPGAISQIITHFVMNTVEHGFSETNNGLIKIYARQEGRNVTLVYEDNGQGMDEEKVQRVFEPFYTSKLGKGTSGLGLNIVYNLVTGVLKGRVTAIGRAGEGMRFTLVFPAIVKDE